MDAHPWVRSLTSAALVALLVVVGLRTCGKPGDPLPPTPPPPTEPTPPTPPTPAPDPVAAIVRTSRPGVGCSATIIGPRRADGRWWVLTASHCTERIGERWSMRFRNGTSGGFTIVNRDPRADCAWGVTDSNADQYPYALLAAATPAVGTRVWHAGFGMHIPGNREDGQVVGGPEADDKFKMMIDVSSGDSGGGIVIDKDGNVCSTVCCAHAGSGVRPTWGATTEAIRRAQREVHDFEAWTPIPLPERMPPKP